MVCMVQLRGHAVVVMKSACHVSIGSSRFPFLFSSLSPHPCPRPPVRCAGGQPCHHRAVHFDLAAFQGTRQRCPRRTSPCPSTSHPARPRCARDISWLVRKVADGAPHVYQSLLSVDTWARFAEDVLSTAWEAAFTCAVLLEMALKFLVAVTCSLFLKFPLTSITVFVVCVVWRHKRRV